MTKVDLKKIQKVANEFDNDPIKINREIKRIQSIKCRLKKQKGRKTYNEEMTQILQTEQILKEARNLITPKKKATTMYTSEDIEKLSYDETIKAIRSIQSKKSLTRWLTTEEGENSEYKNALKIEEMLKAHKDKIAPTSPDTVKKIKVQTILNTLEESGDLDKNEVVRLLKELL